MTNKRGIPILLLATLFVVGISPAFGAIPVPLTTSSASDNYPTWTADGQFVIFESDRAGNLDLWKIPVAGGPAVQLTSSPNWERYPQVSPDGTKVLFTVLEPGPLETASLWTMPVNGGAATRITTAPLGEVHIHPHWSADGSWISFTWRGFDTSRWHIYKVSAAGGPLQPLITDQSWCSQSIPSPDGIHLAWAQKRSPYLSYNNAFLAPLDNLGNVIPVAAGAFTAGPFDFTADGTRLLVGQRLPGQFVDLYEYTLATGASTRVTYDGEGVTQDPYHYDAEYSPDGSQLVYAARIGSSDFNLWLLDLDIPTGTGDTLMVGESLGLPGGAPLRLPVYLNNASAMRGVEFTIEDLPDHLTVTGIEMAPRAQSLASSFADNGAVHVLLYSSTSPTALIAPGSGRILNLLVEVDPGAILGETMDLHATQSIFSGPDHAVGPLAAVDGSFLVERRPGDITGDNEVDAGDIVRLVEIILGTGDPPTAEELAEAECNGDDQINIGDITCLTQFVLSGINAPWPPDIVNLNGGTLIVENAVEVRGLQIATAGGSSTVSPGRDLSPFALQQDAAGRQWVAFDPSGRGWEPGLREVLRLDEDQAISLRAYGPGGRALRVRVAEGRVIIGETIPGLRMLPNTPNPFLSSTAIRFSTDREARFSVDIFDIRGARVRVLADRDFGPGEHELHWDGRDDVGRELPAGIFLATVRGAGTSSALRLTRLGN